MSFEYEQIGDITGRISVFSVLYGGLQRRQNSLLPLLQALAGLLQSGMGFADIQRNPLSGGDILPGGLVEARLGLRDATLILIDDR